MSPAQSADAKKLDVVKYVISVRKADNAKVAAAADRKQKRDQIMTYIAERQATDMRGKSMDELKVMLAALD